MWVTHNVVYRFSDIVWLATKRCGFYNDNLEHGGPSGGEENQAGGIANEQTLLNNGDANGDVIPTDFEIYNPRPNRRRRDADADEFNFVDTGKIFDTFKNILLSNN